MSREVQLVVPCYNEAERLPVEDFLSFEPEGTTRYLFVNDGSSDGTLELLEGMRARAPERVEVMDLQPNRGKAEAVRQGILRALEKEPGYVGFWDADLATPLEAIPDFLRVFEERPGIEWVWGSRVKLMGWQIDRSMARHYAGRVFATAVSSMLVLPIYDSQCGAKLFRVGEGTQALFEEAYTSRWIFDVEILAREERRRRERPELPRMEEVLFEMPLRTWRDVEGSKVKLGDFFWALRDIVRIWWRY